VQHLPKLSTDQGNDGGNNADMAGTACRTPYRRDPAPESTHLVLRTERPGGEGVGERRLQETHLEAPRAD
jgi:hypothetical protein